jgi:glycosyltransferase involved in cell wall biosynthesis
MNNILISVIIPNFNYAQYIQQCLQSVLDSDFDPDKMEIVVVDDASNDESLKLVEEVMKGSRFPFRLIKNETNIGLVLSRNRGIKYAAGEYLFFLDSDNYIRKDCLKIHAATLQQNPDATACYAPIQNFMNKTGEYCGLRSNHPFDYQKLLEGPYIDAMAMFRKKDLIETGLFENKMPPYGWEDYELWLRLGKTGRHVVFIGGEPLSFYRTHALNMSQNYQPDQFNHLVYYLKQKYPVTLSLKQSETLDSLIYPLNHYAQLFYKTEDAGFSEQNSIRFEINKNPFHFKLPAEKNYTALRIDPVNDYAVVNLKHITFFNNGHEIFINPKIKSNAIATENSIYFFSAADPQITIEFDVPLQIDEVVIEIDYLKIGYESINELDKIIKNRIEKLDAQLTRKSEELIELRDKLNQVVKSLKNEIDGLHKQNTVLKDELAQNKSSYFYKTAKLQTLIRPLILAQWLKEKIRLRKNLRRIKKSGLFDEEYYFQNNTDVKKSGAEAARHYLVFGGFEGRNPSRLFNSSFYLKNYKDVKESGMNPLLHFILYGKEEGRLPLSRGFNEDLHLLLTQSGEENIDEIIQLKSEINLFPDAYHKFLHRNRLTNKMTDFLIGKQQEFSFQPLFSIIMPVYNPAINYLDEAINSVSSQIYPHWELILVDDHSNTEVEKFLKSFNDHKKLKYKRLDKNSGVSVATNEGIRLASGDYIIFMDHDDVLEKDALVQIANYLQNNKPGILYTDDGTINHEGLASFPAFKPGWSPELALSFCYVRHIVVYSRAVFLQTGFLNPELDGSQDYDYFLRATHFANQIDHLPVILYHWRNHNDQLHKNKESLIAGMVAVQNNLTFSGIDWVKVTMPEFATEKSLGIYKLNPSKNFDDLVSIIIPVRNGYLLLKKCIDSINKSSYRNFEIIIANDESDELQTVDYLENIEKQGIKVLTVERLNNEFNYSRLNNKAVGTARGDFLIFLNSDTEIISQDWIEQMLMYCKMPGVGIVGARLLFPDQRIQHAGVVVTMDKKPAHHPFIGSFGNGYMNFDLCARNYSAVTAACLMIAKNDFVKTGGFDEINLKVSSNDVDLCLRVLKGGKRVVYNPNALIIHHEGASRNRHRKPVPYLSDDLNLIRKHKNFTDSFYNPNQHNEVFFTTNFNRNNRLHYFEKMGALLKTVFVTHNLNLEGATMVMFKVAKYLKSTGNFQIEVLSQEEGPLRKWYEKEGITVSVLDVFSSLTRESYPEFVEWLSHYLVKSNASMVYANTLDAFWAIDASYFAEIPSIWGIHESTDPIDYYKSHPHFRNLVPWIFKTILKPNRNLFVCKSTMQLFEKYNHYANMDFIYNGIGQQSYDLPDKHNLRNDLKLPADKTIITIIGTICERKGQLDFVKAAKLILKSNNNLHFMIIGKNSDDEYYHQVMDEIGQVADIVILDNQENIMDYFKASDIFVCCSYNESFPLVILEAMSCSLPIVTTPVFGISEQLTDGETALFYNPGEIQQLADKIKFLLDHKNEAIGMGEKARTTVEVLFREEDMMQKYEELFKTVVFEDVVARPLSF